MKSSRFLAIVALLCAASVHVNAAAAEVKDDASQSTYNGGWNEPGGGNGFGDWKFQENHGATDSFAGHFLADTGTNPEMSPVASGSKAFGLYANGPEFEVATASHAPSLPR